MQQQGAQIELRLTAKEVIDQFRKGGEEAVKLSQNVRAAGASLDEFEERMRSTSLKGGRGGLAAFGVGMKEAAAQTRGFGGAAGNSQQALIGMGYALQDATQFSYGLGAGLRSTMNNITPMLAAVGLGGPLILGITALGVAATVFADEIDEAMRVKGVGSADAYKTALAGIVEYKDRAFDVTYQITSLEQLTRVIGILQGRVDELKKDDLSGLNAMVTSGRLALKDALPNGLKWLADPFGNLGEDTRQRLQNAELRGGLEAFAKELGLTKQQAEALQEVLKILEEEGLNPTSNETDRVADRMKRLNEEVAHNRRLLSALQGPYGTQLANLQLENERLEKRIKLREQENRVNAIAARFGLDRAPVPGRMTGRGAQAGGSMIEAEMARGLGSDLLGLRGAGMTAGGAASLKKELDDELFSSLEKFDTLAQNLSGTLQGGLTSAIVGLAAGTGSFKQVLGDFMMTFGESLIAFGVAGVALKTFIANPYLALVAGATLVALGSRLSSSAQDQVNSFAGVGGLGGSRGRSGSMIAPAPAIGRALPAPSVVSSPSIESAISASGNAIAGGVGRERYILVPVSDWRRAMAGEDNRIAKVVPR